MIWNKNGKVTFSRLEICNENWSCALNFMNLILFESTISEHTFTLGNILHELKKINWKNYNLSIYLKKKNLNIYWTARIVLESSNAFSPFEFTVSLLIMIKYSASFIPALNKSSRLCR